MIVGSGNCPGGYVDDQEDPAGTAAREVEEETGWRPLSMERLAAFQPMVSTLDAENIVFLALGAEYVGDPTDINEAQSIAWIPLVDVQGMMERGEIVGSASVIGLLAAMARL